MAITSRCWGSPLLDTFDDGAALQTYVFDPRLEIGAARIGDRLRLEPPEDHASSDVCVIRLAAEREIEVTEADPLVRQILGERPTCFLLGSGGAGTPELRFASWSEHANLRIEKLRAAEVHALLIKSGALVHASAIEHFILPAGDHAEDFVRVADALLDPVDVSRLTDWVVPFLRESRVALVDTGSLLALMFSAVDQLNTRFANRLAIHALPAYPGENAELLTRLEQVLVDDPAAACLPVVISVNSSGRLVKRLSALSPVPIKAVAICDRSGIVADEVEPLLELPLTRWPLDAGGRCSECSDRARLYVHPVTYQVSREPVYEPHKLDRAFITRHAELWQALERSDAVRLHANVPPRGLHPEPRHFGVYIEFDKLFQDETFRDHMVERFRTFVASREVPDVVLIPNHSASDALEHLVRTSGLNSTILRVDVGAFVDSVRDAISRARSVLLVDDVLVNGRTLVNLKSQIYEVLQRVESDECTVSAFVVVARPPHTRALETLRRRFRGRDGLRLGAGIEIRVPADCPWCAERDLLARWAPKIDGSLLEGLRDRRDDLRDEMITPAFLTAKQPPEAATVGSFMGPLSRKAAFAAFACVAQEFRDEILDDVNTSMIKVVDVRMLLDCYFDDVFVGGALRTLGRLHLRAPDQEEATTEAILELAAANESDSFAAELGWAAANGKLPANAVLQILNSRAVTVETELLSQLIRLNGF